MLTRLPLKIVSTRIGSNYLCPNLGMARSRSHNGIHFSSIMFFLSINVAKLREHEVLTEE